MIYMKGAIPMKIESNVLAGLEPNSNHNETLARRTNQAVGMPVKTRVKASATGIHHNETGFIANFCIRIAILAIASSVFVAHAQAPEKFHVSNDTAGGSASWFNPTDFTFGQLGVFHITDPLTNNTATFIDFQVLPRPGLFVFVSCFAPPSALSSKTFNSVSFHLANLSTCDGGRFQFAAATDCTSGVCVNVPLPDLSLNVTLTKLGVRTYQRSGTESQVFQDFNGNIFSTQTSGIQTRYDATFVGDLNGAPIAGGGLIFFSKGVTISFTKTVKP